MPRVFQEGYVNLRAFGDVATGALRSLAGFDSGRALLETDLMQCLLSQPASWLEEALAGTANSREAVLKRLGGPVAAGGAAQLACSRLGRMIQGVLEQAEILAQREACAVIAESHLIRSHIDRISSNTSNLYHRLGIDPARLRAFFDTHRTDRSPAGNVPVGPKEPAPASHQLLAGRYRIDSILATGGMGIVYLAYDEDLLGSKSTRVAIKMMLPEAQAESYLKRKFFQEFESLTRMNHPNIVRVLGRGQHPDGAPFIVMEYIDGEVLRAQIAQQGMDRERVGRLVRQLGSALTYLHEFGILHCDLKPENIMIQKINEREELLKLIDFGVAKVQDSRMAPTMSGTRIGGTLRYCSPEHLTGKLDQASDTYSFGVLSYELLTGMRPFKAENEVELYQEQKQGVPLGPLQAVAPKAAVSAIAKALSLDPGKRYLRSREFGEELEQALSFRADPSYRQARPNQEAAYLLFIEPLGHRQMHADQQMKCMAELTRMAHSAAQQVEEAGTLAWLPAQDSLVCAFFGDPALAADCGARLSRDLRRTAHLQVRMSICNALVFRAPGDEARVAPEDIRAARLLAQLGDSGHILVAMPVADLLRRLSQWAAALADLGEHRIDGHLLRVFNLCLEESGNSAIPSSIPPKAASATAPESRITPGTPEPPSAPPPTAPKPEAMREYIQSQPQTVAPKAEPRPDPRQTVAPKLEPRPDPPPPTKPKSAEFDERSIAILERAEASARRSGRNEITTSDLFLGLLVEAPAEVAGHLELHGGNLDALRRLFERLLEPGRNSGPAHGGAKWGKNSKSILEAAVRAGGGPATPANLAAAFAQHATGSAVEILKKCRVELYTGLGARLETPTGIGGIQAKDCASDGWNALQLAARITGRDSISSEELLRAIHADRAGELAAALRNVGVRWPYQIVPELQESAISRMVDCSDSVAEVLSFARELAASSRQLINVSGLLQATVTSAKGQALEKLLANGLPCVECLTSRIFRDGGLDSGRFSPAAQQIFDLMLAFAVKKRQSRLRVRHLLFGMLDAPGGLFESRLAKQGLNAEVLADLLHHDTEPGNGRSPLRAVVSDMDVALVQLLCRAERYAEGAVIGDAHLLRSVQLNAYDAAELLIRNGVKWRLL